MRSGIFDKRLIAIIGISLVIIALLLSGTEISNKNLRTGLEEIKTNPDYQENLKLGKFPVSNQLYAWSCGPTTISMVYTYLIEPKSEEQILEENKLAHRNKGMLPATFEKYLRDSLPGLNVEMKSGIPDGEVIRIIYNQLQQGLPVPVYFSTVNEWDKPNYDTHYSAVIGIDLKKETVVIGNAYGFEEEVKVNDFLASLKYDNYKNKPLAFRLAVMVGVIKKNNIYLLTKV